MVEAKEVTFSTGVKVRLSRPRSLLIQKVRTEFLKNDPEPEPPVVHNADYDRDEPNLSDPSYRQAYGEWAERLGIRVIDVMIATSLEIVEIPEDTIEMDSEDFNSLMEIAGIPAPDTHLRRKVEWVKAIAASNADLEILEKEITEISGATEEMVAERMKLFRGDTTRNSDRAISSVE